MDSSVHMSLIQCRSARYTRSFVLGPPRCGKSGFAEALTLSRGQTPIYVATLPRSAEFNSKIAAHQARRDARWTCVEIQADWDLFKADLLRHIGDGRPIFLDGLSALIWFYVFSDYSTVNHRYETIRDELLDMLTCETRAWMIVDALQGQTEVRAESHFQRMSLDIQNYVKAFAQEQYVIGTSEGVFARQTSAAERGRM